MKARNWIALALGTAVSLGAAYAAYTLANYSWNQVVDYRSPYVEAELPETPAPSQVRLKTERVVYVIVDGLRDDASRKMPNLQRLRAGGFDAVVRTGEPSLSFPNWTALLSGVPQRFSGVTTNWFEERVPVETLVDTALRTGRGVVVSAPTDFEMLYGVKRAEDVFLKDWTAESYMSGEIVDNALEMAGETTAALVLVHLPDIDEAGHAFGGASPEYAAMAAKVDKDLGRMVARLQDGVTTFVIAADHGHIDTGGHGGWESEVVDVPVVLAGPDIRLGKDTGTQDQVASTVAYLAGLPVPRHTTAAPLRATFVTADLQRFDDARLAALNAYGDVLLTAMPTGSLADARPAATVDGAAARFERFADRRLTLETASRVPMALGLAGGALAVLLAIGLLSWRALVSAGTGTVFYYLVYNGLFFLLHGYRWSLSSFNSESLLKAFFNGRMVEAVVAGVVAAFVAADVYLALRRPVHRPKGEFLPGWIALGTATVLVIQATLALQVAWYLWRWGVNLTWVLPDFQWAFKYDLDLIQATALGAAVILAPLVTYLVGRFHPVREVAADAPASAAAAPAATPAPVEEV